MKDRLRETQEEPPPEPDGDADDSRPKTVVEPVDDDAWRQTVIEPMDDFDSLQNSPSTNLFGVSDGDFRKTVFEPVDQRSNVDTKKPSKDAKPSINSIVGELVAERYRPSSRPPIAKLFVLDDCGTEAEVIRIRGGEFLIGRTIGDLVLPHDPQMSSKHVQISRKQKDGQWHWLIKDFNSTNGTFFRSSTAPLTTGGQVFIGSRLYRFRQADLQSPSERPPASLPSDENHQTLIVGGNTNAASALNTQTQSQSAYLTDICNGRRYDLGLRQWIGRDRTRCQVVLDDPTVGDQEAEIFYDDQSGQWRINKGQSINGIWIRLQRISLQNTGAQFQCGEQRFELRLTKQASV